MRNALLNTNTEWKFIPSRAPWMGGFWERLVGIIKNLFKRIIGKKLLTFDEFRTVISQCENVANNRPLTYQSAQDSDLIPITPNMLIYGRGINAAPYLQELPDCEADYSFDNPSKLTKSQKRLHETLKVLWQQWRTEYINQLKERDKLNEAPIKGKRTFIPKVGDVCILHLDKLDHLGRIKKLCVSEDGAIRSAEVLIKGKTAVYPLAKLSHLECSNSPIPQKVLDNIEPRAPSSRAAAKRARSLITQSM